MQSDLDIRKQQKVKVEYNKVVLKFADKLTTCRQLT